MLKKLTVGLAALTLVFSAAAYSMRSDSAFVASAYTLNEPTQEEIIKKFEEIYFSTETEAKYDEDYSTTSPYVAGAISQEDRINGLNAVNFCRYVAGLPADIQLKDEYNNLAQVGSLLNAVNNVLTHYPEQPADMDDEMYQQGYNATSHSNLGSGYYNIADSVINGYMSDSDTSNIDRVGHRRWVLNPDMLYTGFGMVGRYTSMYAFDKSRTEDFTGDYVAWPGKNMPYQIYTSWSDSYAFSVTLGDSYDFPSLDSVTVDITSEKLGKSWHLDNTSTEFDNYLNVCNNYYANPKCIIFHVGMFPENDTVSVTINGITKSGVETPISYEVNFFELYHTYTKTVTTAATCTTDGLMTYTCTGCGHTYTETIPAKGHNYSTVITTSATCTTAGKTTYKCSRCTDSYSVTIQAKGHSYTKTTVDATCTTAGKTTYKCSTCGHTYSETIAAKGHNYTKTTVDATCTTAGKTTYKCSTCGHTYSETIAAKGHSYTKTTVAATCTTAGKTTYKCSTCGHTYSETIAAKGHSYTKTTVAATCTTAGKTTYKCSTCGHTYSETIAAKGHNYTKTTVAATCTTAGKTTYKCSTCGHTYSETIAAKGHNYTKTTVDATCTTAGKTTYKCSTCGHTYSETIAAKGHSYTKTTVAATCTTAGKTTYKCSTCGHTYSETIPAKGHSYTKTTVDATCTTAGKTTYKCSTCGHTYSETIAAKGHNYTKTTVAATCTTAGKTTYKCSTCGHTYSETIAAKGHNYTKTTVDATCTTAGKTTYKCSTCGHTYSETIAAKGHSYKQTVVAPTLKTEGYTLYECTKCGDSYKSNYTDMLKVDAPTPEFTRNSSSAIRISWNKVDGADGYQVLIYKNGKWNSRVLANTTTTYAFKNLKAGTSYKVTVKAFVNVDGKKQVSDRTILTATTKPAAPTPKISSTGKNSIKISWNKVNGATNYQVLIYKNGKWNSKIISSSTTSYTFKNLKAGTTYKVTVKAIRTLNGTKYISGRTILNGSTKTIAPTPKVAAKTKNSVTMSWNKVDGATKYQVLIYKNGKWNSAKLSADRTSYTFKNLKSGTSYKITVKALRTVDGKTYTSDRKILTVKTS